MAAQHSDRPISTMMTIPGIKLIAPTSPYDVKGMLATAIRYVYPVFCFEDSTLWGVSGEVPDEEYLIPLGLADVKREGSDVSIVAVAGAVQAALEAADALAGEGISCEVVDPRTIVPLDVATILSSVEKTGHLVVADPCPEMGSVAVGGRGGRGRARFLAPAGTHRPRHRSPLPHSVQPADGGRVLSQRRAHQRSRPQDPVLGPS